MRIKNKAWWLSQFTWFTYLLVVIYQASWKDSKSDKIFSINFLSNVNNEIRFELGFSWERNILSLDRHVLESSWELFHSFPFSLSRDVYLLICLEVCFFKQRAGHREMFHWNRLGKYEKETEYWNWIWLVFETRRKTEEEKFHINIIVQQQKNLDNKNRSIKKTPSEREEEKCRQLFGDMICGVLKQHSTKAQWNLLTEEFLLLLNSFHISRSPLRSFSGRFYATFFYDWTFFFVIRC